MASTTPEQPLPDSSEHQSFSETLEPLHPEASVRSRQPWGLLLGGVLILAGGAWAGLQLLHPASPPLEAASHSPAIPVETLTVQPQAIATTLELSGTIRPLEQAVLSTRVMGRITQLSLEAGDRFTQGQVLARVDVMDMAAQTNQAQSAVIQAQSAVAQRQAEFSQAQATLTQLESQKLEAQAALELAQMDQSRMSKLQAEGAVSQERLDQANSALAQSRARVAQMQAGIRQAQAAIGRSQAAIAQSQAAVSQAKSTVTSASVSESYGNVIAPFNGVVVQKFAYTGEMAAPGTPLLKVENPDRLQLEISVPESNLRFVRPGQGVSVQVDAVNRTFGATIQQIVPAADPNSRSFLVKIPLHNSGGLISGMFGRIALPLGAKQETLLIPDRALVQRGQLQGVYVIDSDSQPAKAVLRWVKTGKRQRGQVEIVSGLVAGDRIITSNLAKLQDGQAVEVSP